MRLEKIFLPDILIPVTKLAPGRALFACAAFPALCIAAWWSARLAWADHLSRGADLQDRARAAQLAPASAIISDRLAGRREELGLDPLPPLRRAATLDPTNAERYMRLGLRAELAGDPALAERALLRAAECSRLYQPRFLLAQYYFRQQNADLFFQWARGAFDSAYGDVRPIFDLWWRMQPETDSLIRESLAQRPEIERQALTYLLTRGETAGASTLARHIVEHATPEDRDALLAYCDDRLAAADPAALEIWNELCRRGLLAGAPLDASRLTPSPAAPSTGRGCDWRAASVQGVRIADTANGWRIDFSGNQPEYCLLGWQYIPVRRGARYQLQFNARTLDGGSAPGVTASVFVLSPEKIWTELASGPSPAFTPPAEVIRAALIYRRPLGYTRLTGEVTVEGWRVEAEP
jgi:hypothetical protein